MFLIEIKSPRDALTDDARGSLAGDIRRLLVGAEKGVAEETMQRARSLTHIGFGELESWTTGDGPWIPGTVPPLWVTLTVPEAWRAEMSRTAIGIIRRSVRRLDRRQGWQRPDGALWINLVGIEDGSLGMDGHAVSGSGVVSHMTAEFRARLAAEAPAASDTEPDAAGATQPVGLSPGIMIDPMCGMQVRLGPGALTLEHAGRTVVFCAAACRAAYADEYGLPLPS